MRFKQILILLLCLLSLNGLWAQGKDFLLSLAVPGFSQVRSGRDYGYLMLAAEAALFGTSYYLANESDLLLEESYVYALKYAHINPSDYDAEFFKNLGKYDSSGFDARGYNATVRHDAQFLHPDDPVAQQIYIDNHAYGEDRYWSWDAGDNRSEYNRMRNDSLDLESYGKLVVGMVILNHLVSGIDVLRYHSQDRRAQLSVDMVNDNPLLKLSVRF